MYIALLAWIAQCQVPLRTATESRSEASFDRGVEAEVSAKGASRSAIASSRLAADAAEDINNLKPVMDGTIKEAKLRAELAAKDEEAAKEALEAVGIASQHTIDTAGTYASKKVEEKLGPVFQKMQEWKMAVLHNPLAESRKAAERASRPYHRAMMKLEKQVNEYQQRAESLNSQALGLQRTAEALANTAVAKQAAVDLKGAQTDMMNAHHMMYQAAQFGQQAFKLQEKAKALQVNLPAYRTVAQMTAQAAAHRYDPEHVSAPPVSPQPYTPPLPTDVFLQVK